MNVEKLGRYYSIYVFLHEHRCSVSVFQRPIWRSPEKVKDEAREANSEMGHCLFVFELASKKGLAYEIIDKVQVSKF